MFIYSIDLLAEIYLDDQLIYRFGKLDEQGRGRFAGWPWHQVELPQDFSKRQLSVRVFSDYTDIGLWGEVKLIERSELLLRILQTSAFDLLVVAFCLTLALLALAFAAMQPGHTAFFWLGLLVLGTAGKLLGENQAVQLLIDAPLFRTYLAALSYYSLPIFIALLMRQWLFDAFSQKSLLILAWLHLAYLVFAALASWAGWVQLAITYPIFDGLLILSLSGLLFLIWRSFKQLSHDQRWIVFAFAILAVFLLFDMFVAHGFLPWQRFPLSLGVLVFALVVFLSLLWEYRRSQEALRELNATLEERIHHRTQSLQTYAQLERQRSHQLTLFNQYHQQAEDLLKQLNTCASLEQALAFLEKKLPQGFRPNRLYLQYEAPPESTDTSESWYWSLHVEDLTQGRQTPAYLHIQPDESSQDPQQLEALSSFFMRTSERLSMSLSAIRLRQDLQRLSYEDGLTGLKNRRYMDTALNREISLAKRQKTPLSVLVCDIDHFKHFNDRYGHDAGDFVLRNLATALLEHFRETDLPCRYGGEEFVVIMPGADEQTALKRAKELISKIAKRDLIYQDTSIGQVTLSIGVANWPDKALTPEELLKAADRALYQAKQSGRNRAVLASEPGSR